MIQSKEIRLVSVIIPVFNEADSLPELLRRTRESCDKLSIPYEVILVDDGSQDGSVELLSEAAQGEESPFMAVLLNRNYGQHAAIMAGFCQASGEVMVTLDADLQNPPEAIPQLVAAAAQGYDVVGTVRQERQDTKFRKITSSLTNWVIKTMTGQAMGDYGCMLRAYQLHIVKAMIQCQERSTFIPLLANSFARHTIELPIEHAERQHGESKYSLGDLFNLWFDLMTCMTTKPLRLLSIVGGTVATLGISLAILLFVLRLIYGSVWAAHGVFTLFAVMFSFMGVQLMGMGLLGEYVGRIYNEVRARPRYFIHKVIHKGRTTCREGMMQ